MFGILIPAGKDYHDSDKSVIQLLKEAKKDIDLLSAKYSLLATNADVVDIYAKVDGAIYKLEEAMPSGQVFNKEKEEKEPADEASLKDMTGKDVAKLVWGLLTDE